jgi:hypothetical protein
MAPLPSWPTGAATPTVTFRPLPTRFAPGLIAYHDPSSTASGHYRDLLAVLRSTAGRSSACSQALLFTAVQTTSLTTTVLLNVAITAARQGGLRVVVVDANLSHPCVAEQLGLEDAPGLREVLGGATTLSDALQTTLQPDLHVLTTGEKSPPAGIRLVTETMRSLLRQLRQQFDLVFVEGPPSDGRPEATLVGVACDAVFLVVPDKEAESPRIDELLRTLPLQGIRLAGCILTDH